MKLLVVTPTLGRSPWLDATITSVTALPMACRHLLVCPSAVRADLEKRFPQHHVVAEAGLGMYAAINAGLAAAGGDWDAFTYINDDDLLLPGFAAHAEALGRAESGPMIAYGNVKLIDDCGRRLGAIPVSPFPSMNRALYAQRIEPVYQHGTLVTRAALDVLHGFDASFRFCGDSEFLARACMSGLPFMRTGGSPVAAFRLRTGQLTKDRAAMMTERVAVDAKLHLVGSQSRLQRWIARVAFRSGNLPIYAERILRHGLVSFDELLAQS